MSLHLCTCASRREPSIFSVRRCPFFLDVKSGALLLIIHSHVHILFCLGVIRFFCSSHPDAVALRKTMVVVVVPMLNPDGIRPLALRFIVVWYFVLVFLSSFDIILFSFVLILITSRTQVCIMGSTAPISQAQTSTGAMRRQVRTSILPSTPSRTSCAA